MFSLSTRWIIFNIITIYSATIFATSLRVQKGTLTMTSLSGQVQVLFRNSWFSVCADRWDGAEADVVCRILGNYSNSFVLTIPFNYSDNHVVTVACSGYENDVCDCNITTTHYCQTRHLAGAGCEEDSPTIRLANGHVAADSASGRVEVFHNGHWGTVCDDNWDDLDARVVCRMLGYPSTGAYATTRAYFGQGQGHIFLDDVRCTGNETSLFHCSHNGWDVSNCNHFEDAGVECRYAHISTLEVSLKQGYVSKSSVSGRVEVTRGEVEGAVCDDRWDTHDADVVCRTLGIPFERTVALSNSAFGSGDVDIMLDDVHCLGNETNLSQCRHRRWGSHNCDMSETASVLCQRGYNKNESIRLVDGSYTAGTVEVLHKGSWGNIGDRDWDDKDAVVVCRMLGFPNANATAQTGSFYGKGRYETLVERVRCTGNETSIFYCPHTLHRHPDYEPDNVAGVDCSPEHSGDVSVRLVNGHYSRDSAAGRVEVFHGGRWGTVCHDGWDDNDARVVCKMLGLPHTGAQAKHSAYFGAGSTDALLNHVRCVGVEESLSQCNHSGWGNHTCVHSEDAGVLCQKDESSVQVELVGGLVTRSSARGRLNVLSGGVWGTVCDSGWNADESAVICRMLGYSGAFDQLASATPATTATTTSTTTSNFPITFHGVFCRGNETNILQCRHFTNQLPFCTPPSKPTNVSCYTETRSPGTIRLTEVTTTDQAWSGRIEMYVENKWTPFCTDQWGDNETFVVCRSLGFSQHGTTQGEIVEARFSHLYEIQCAGFETHPSQCSGFVINKTDCTSGKYVKVTCVKEISSSSTNLPKTAQTDDSTPFTPSSLAITNTTNISSIIRNTGNSQFPTTVTSYSQSPTTVTLHSHSPTTVTSYSQTPTTVTSPSQTPTTAMSHSHSPTTVMSYSQTPTTATSYSQTPTTATSYSQTPTTVTSYSQTPTTATSYSQSLIIRTSHSPKTSRDNDMSIVSFHSDTTAKKNDTTTSVQSTSATKPETKTKSSKISASSITKSWKDKSDTELKTPTKFGMTGTEIGIRNEGIIAASILVPTVTVVAMLILVFFLYRRFKYHNTFSLGFMSDKEDDVSDGYFNPVYEVPVNDENEYCTLDFIDDSQKTQTNC